MTGVSSCSCWGMDKVSRKVSVIRDDFFFSRNTIVYCHNTTNWTPTWWGTTRPSLLENASGSMIMMESTQLPGGLWCPVREYSLESDNPGHSEGNKKSKCLKDQDVWTWVLALTSTVRSWVIWNLSVLPKYSGSEVFFLFLFLIISSLSALNNSLPDH